MSARSTVLHVANPAASEKGETMSKQTPAAGTRTPMTTVAASRIQSATARVHGGKVPFSSFAARAQSAAAKNSGGKSR